MKTEKEGNNEVKVESEKNREWRKKIIWRSRKEEYEKKGKER